VSMSPEQAKLFRRLINLGLDHRGGWVLAT
jgi:hypothetical protein